MTTFRDMDEAAGAPPPKPQMTAKGAGIAAVLWLLYAVLYTGLVVQRTEFSFVRLFPGQLLDHALLALYSVPVWLLVVRHLDAWSWRRKILLHLLIGPVYAWLGLQTMLWGTEGAGRREIVDNAQWIYFTLLTLYVLQFTLYHMVSSVQRLRWREQQAAELMALARERELAALKAQINPHFLFNALNTINAMAGDNAEATRETVTQLGDLLRYALDSTDRAWVLLREEVDFAQAYLDLEARRFSDRLRVHYDVDPAVLDAPVPPMVLQPLVENAVKHGIGPSERGGTITLRIQQARSRLEVSVEDTGVGASVNGPRGGIGLANTSARLERLFGPEAALHTDTVTPRGFRVWFSIPWRPVEVPQATAGPGERGA